jgi:hypothetical protein
MVSPIAPPLPVLTAALSAPNSLPLSALYGIYSSSLSYRLLFYSLSGFLSFSPSFSSEPFSLDFLLSGLTTGLIAALLEAVPQHPKDFYSF